MGTTAQFRTIKAAKDYIIEKIAAEAARQSIPLSKVEREMLYFTEEGGLSKHMEKVYEEFDRQCNDDEYEAKIGSLAQSVQSHLTPEEQELWDDAVLKLCDGDHYLLVLIDAGAQPESLGQGLWRWLPNSNSNSSRPPGDRLRLILVALIVFVLILAAMVLLGRR